MNGQELAAGDRYVVAQLRASPRLVELVADRIYGHTVPDLDTATFPYVAFSVQDDVTNLLGHSGAQVLYRPTYFVKAVHTATSFGGVVAELAGLIYAQLHGTERTLADGTYVSSIREHPRAYPERSGGVEYRHAGGVFRLAITPS